jgi:hypothetical protein
VLIPSQPFIHHLKCRILASDTKKKLQKYGVKIVSKFDLQTTVNILPF